MKSKASDGPEKGHDTILQQEGRRDQVFAKPKKSKDFKFDAETAVVFDDMVNRSVPFYGEIQRMVCELSRDFSVPGTNLYDIGCATGTTLLALDKMLDSTVRLIGLDNSREMLDVFREKIVEENIAREISLHDADLNQPQQFSNASVVIALLTLQFVRPLHRESLVNSIYQGLGDNGCLIIVEKVTGSSTILNRLFIEHYYDYKRRSGYSDLEIAQKREALENVLIPYHDDENRTLLARAGFRFVEEFFRWYNFAGIIAVK